MTGLLAGLRTSAVRSSGSRGLHQRAEKSRGKRVVPHALGVPLHSDDPMFMRFMFDSFDHTVWSNSCNTQTVA